MLRLLMRLEVNKVVSANRGSNRSLFFAVVISTFIALVLMLIQFPSWFFNFWPDWVAIVVIFWSLHQPERFGPVAGFIIGMLMEVLFVHTFGVWGLGLASLAFIVNSTHQQLRVLSVWQQIFVIGLFIAVFKFIIGWFSGMVSDFVINSQFWYSLLGDILVWPFVTILLHELRRMLRLR